MGFWCQHLPLHFDEYGLVPEVYPGVVTDVSAPHGQGLGSRVRVDPTNGANGWGLDKGVAVHHRATWVPATELITNLNPTSLFQA